MADVLGNFSQSDADGLCAEVGAGQLTGQGVKKYVPRHQKVNKSRLLSFARMRRRKSQNQTAKHQKGWLLRDADIGHSAALCRRYHTHQGIHCRNCHQGQGNDHSHHELKPKDFADTPERWIDVAWDEEAIDEFHLGRVSLVVGNAPGSLGGLCTIIGNNAGNISNLKITNRTPEFFDMSIDVREKGRQTSYQHYCCAALRLLLSPLREHGANRLFEKRRTPPLRQISYYNDEEPAIIGHV